MVICIVGLGYVGLPLSLAFSEKNFKVIGFDSSYKRIRELNDSKDINNEFSKEELNSSKNRIEYYLICNIPLNKIIAVLKTILKSKNKLQFLK